MSLMTVGQLARKTGVTVRALHHYEAIGLLRPAGRSPAGYRLYGRDQMERLAAIQVLRQMGMALADIEVALRQPSSSLDHLLQCHMHSLQTELGQRRRQLQQLQSIITAIRGRKATIDELSGLMEALKMFDKYYSSEQQEQLAQHREQMGDERITHGQQQWAELFAALRKAMVNGIAPEAEEVQVLIGAAKDLLAQFTAGDTGIRESMAEMYRNENPVTMMRGFGMDMDQELWAYYQRAMACLTPGEDGQSAESPS